MSSEVRSVDWGVARRGVIDALPMVVPVVPFGLIIGLAVRTSGMDPFLGWSTSWWIFGGAAQLTLISLIGSGAALAAAISAALVVNARHLMYSAALAPTFQRQPAWFRWVGPYVLIDQNFALASVRTSDDPAAFRVYYLAAGATFWTLWQATTAIGLAVGPVIPDQWNLGFAVPILFLGLVVIGIDHWPKLVAALAGAGTTFLASGLPNRAGLLVGAFIGIVAGTLAEWYRSRRSRSEAVG